MSEITGPTHCCLATIARILACLTRCAVSAQEVLNTVWYRFALCTTKKAGRWPNYTTGKLYDLPELRYNVRRGRVEAVQVYQFDHVGQRPYETTV